MRISEKEKQRRIRSAQAGAAINKVWEEFDLSTLDWLELLAREVHAITTRYRQMVEPAELEPPRKTVTLGDDDK